MWIGSRIGPTKWNLAGKSRQWSAGVPPALRSHYRKMKTKKQKIAFVYFVSFLVVTITGIVFKAKSSLAPYDELAFNAMAWRSAHTQVAKVQRAKMADDLVRNHLKEGMTIKQITSLLGLPDKRQDSSGFAAYGSPKIKEVYIYDMGHIWMDMAGQHHILCIYFDASQRCLSTEIAKD